MTKTKHRAIWVAKCDPGETCETPGCLKHPANYSIVNGSGYVTACRDHAQELIDERVEEGEIFNYDDVPSACERNGGMDNY